MKLMLIPGVKRKLCNKFCSLPFLIMTLLNTGCYNENAEGRNNESIYRSEGDHFIYILYDGVPHSLLAAGNFPIIEELNSNFNEGNYKIYDVGYLLSNYIIHDFGKSAYVNLIRSNANIEETLGISTSQFERGWKKFVINKYFYQHEESVHINSFLFYDCIV